MKNNNSYILPDAVSEMAHIPITGNVVPSMWFQTITYENGKPDTNSILILADIVYWYRPTEVRDERSGSFVGFKKKFSEDLLRRSYSDFEEQFGLSKKQSRDCLIRLENLGVIRRVFRTVHFSGSILNNVLYIELIPSVLESLTHAQSKIVENPCVSDPSNFKVTTSLHQSYQVVPQKLPGGDIEVTPSLQQSYHHIETNTSSEITSNISLSQGAADLDNLDLPKKTKGADPYGQNDQIDLPKRADGSGSNDQIVSDHRVKFFLSPKKEEREEFSYSKKMVQIWNEVVPEKTINANSYLLSKLELALREQLGGDIEVWRTVCQNFKSSKFLMGEADNQRINPTLSWLLDPKEPRVDWVLTKNHYTFDDRLFASKQMIDLKKIEEEITTLPESSVAQDIRLFVLQSNPGFYQSYLQHAKIEVCGELVLLWAGSSFAKEKIYDVFFAKLKIFLEEKYKMSLEMK